MSGVKFLLTLVWPFVRNMVLNGKSIMEALKHNKGRLLFAFLVTGSFILNAIVIGRVVAISREHVLLQHKYDVLLEGSRQNPIHNGMEVTQNKERPPPVVVDPIAANRPVEIEQVKPREPKHQQAAVPKDANSEERYNRLRKQFELMREQERRADDDAHKSQ